MSLLDDARRLSENDAYVYSEYGDYCHFCNGKAWEEPPDGSHHIEHAPDCPWLAMPKIVAALEAADALIAAMAYPPAAYDEWQALVVAIRGEDS